MNKNYSNEELLEIRKQAKLYFDEHLVSLFDENLESNHNGTVNADFRKSIEETAQLHSTHCFNLANMAEIAHYRKMFDSLCETYINSKNQSL